MKQTRASIGSDGISKPSTAVSRLIRWGQEIGVATGSLVKRMLETRQHPEHGYRACLVLLSLARELVMRSHLFLTMVPERVPLAESLLALST